MAKEHLSEDRKRQLEEMFQVLHRHNFYTILNIKQDADRNSIRRAYFAMSKLCHPDNYADKDLGPYLAYMEKIFQACSKAYDVLGNAKKRKRYDEYLASKADTAQLESMAGSLSSEGDLHSALKDPTSTEAQDMRPPPPVVPAPSVQEAGAASVGPSVPPQRIPSSPPGGHVSGQTSSVPPGLDPTQRLRHEQMRKGWGQQAAKRGLLRSLTGARSAEVSAKSHMLLDEARKARDGGQAISALNALRMAVTVDPENGEAKTLLGEVMAEASGDLARRYFEQARSELEFGDATTALRSIEKSLKLVPEDPEYSALGAEILLASDGDLHKAYGLIQASLLRDPRKPVRHLLMGKILLKAGLSARAKTALESAVALDPKLEEAKRMLARL